MLTPFAQVLTHSSFIADWLAFKNQAHDVQSVQRKILSSMLKRHAFLQDEQDFLRQPVRDYSEMTAKLAEVSGTDLSLVRYQPTSGSGEKEKLIPYTSDFIHQFNRALNPWLFDMCLKHPKILGGKHYWSISWLPTHWRQKGWQLDDFDLLPSWKKKLIEQLLAVPNEVSQAKTLSSSQFATLAYLIATKDLTFFSVWSPTFLLQLLELTDGWKEPLIKTLETGKWQLFAEELKHLKAPKEKLQANVFKQGLLCDLWPCLELISSWDSSTSTGWAKKLHGLFPDAKFQGKGLWATEGVVSIPFENKYVLSYQSHYYEFMELKTGNLLSPTQLKEGMEVHPVITCANGFTRYSLKDRLHISGFYKSVPTLEFLERDNSFDMVGEKLDTHAFLQLHDSVKEYFPHLKWVIAFAVNSKSAKPYYSFVLEGEEFSKKVLDHLKKILDDHFHYHLARELGQLDEEQIFIAPDAFNRYEQFQLRRGMVQGNIKVELAYLIKDEQERSLSHEYFIKRA